MSLRVKFNLVMLLTVAIGIGLSWVVSKTDPGGQCPGRGAAKRLHHDGNGKGHSGLHR